MATHVVLITHTERLLEPALLGAATQTRSPGEIVVGVDGDDPAIGDVVEAAADRVQRPMHVVTRPHQGEARSGQVRNNAIRALIDMPGVTPEDRVVVLDGDTIPAFDCLDAHERIGGPRHTVLAFRFMLTEAQTDAIDPECILAGSPPCDVTSEQIGELTRRGRHWRRKQLLRPLGLTKRHKPQLISCNFSCPLSAWIDVNGFDEQYTQYGYEDDDFGRRIYRAGYRPRTAYLEAIAWHQYHPTRAGLRPMDSPNFDRFRRPWSLRCEHGLVGPATQPAPTIVRVGPVTTPERSSNDAH